MIQDQELAREISDLMRDITARVDASVAFVQGRCPHTEFVAYRRCAGRIMGVILVEVLNPLYQQHPHLKPPGFDEPYGN